MSKYDAVEEMAKGALRGQAVELSEDPNKDQTMLRRLADAVLDLREENLHLRRALEDSGDEIVRLRRELAKKEGA